MFAIIAVASAASDDAHAETLKSQSVADKDSFNYAYETSNGIFAKSQGQVKQIGSESGIATQGEYSYNSPEGEKISVSYVSDCKKAPETFF